MSVSLDDFGREGEPVSFIVTVQDAQDAPTDLEVELISDLSEDGAPFCAGPGDDTGAFACDALLDVGLAQPADVAASVRNLAQDKTDLATRRATERQAPLVDGAPPRHDRPIRRRVGPGPSRSRQAAMTLSRGARNGRAGKSAASDRYRRPRLPSASTWSKAVRSG